MEEKNEQAKRQRQEAIENNELNKTRDRVTGQSVVLPHIRAELLSNQTEDDGNKCSSIDGNSMVMMKFMANDDIQKKINVAPIEHNLEQSTSSKTNQSDDDDDNDGKHKLH
ncbi:unnamed protein product [Rotaria socialis]|uniref:Uncharacterized protein n=1 Tax=Rotaria socialis TaxID=392032 RepID=A0A820KKD7_9BILA|nr:unnamed protein product [Rotaria socialis]CAF3340067.1 unnamed protein product [Rotaria socialis]CAF3344864.1 unnamed protein product [Rotaria socialis]CAF3378246.1 unnamed protein product [Rotaria socialis]CAF3423331.1 unnamed protein product [Rotaria socialis]